MNWYIVGFLIYIVVLAGVSIIGARRVKEASDFLVAGRKMPMWLLAMTFAGLWFGGGTLIGTSGTAFDLGIWSSEWAWGIIPDPYGAGLCLILCGLFYFTTIRKMGGVTLADFFSSRFGKRAALVSTIVMSLGWFFWIATQILVVGKVLEAVLGWPFATSIWIGMAVIVAYTVAGGLWSVALTDFVQMILILVGITAAIFVGLHLVGGWSEVTATVPSNMLNFFPTHVEGISSLHAWWAWIAGWMIIGLGSIASPDIMQVAASGETDKVVRRSAIGAGLIYWVWGSIVVMLGLVGYTMISKGLIPIEALAGDPELIVPVMVQTLFPLPVAVIFIAAILAAVMSCADGALLAISTLFSKNVIKDWIKPELTDKELLKWARILIVAVAIIPTVIALNYPHAYLMMNFGFDCLLAGLFVPLTLGIYWRKANSAGAIAGFIVGIVVRVILAGILEGWAFETVMYPANWYMYTAIAPLANLAAMIIVSLATQKSHPPMLLVDAEGNPLE